MSFFDFLNLKDTFSRMRSSSGIHVREDFLLILERERARTDRTGHEFSLVVFGIGSATGSIQMTTRYLETAIRKRARNSDAIGWFDDHALAAILPGTSPDGALKFAEAVRQSAAPRITVLHTTIYSYPTNWIEQKGTACKASDEVAAPGGIACSLVAPEPELAAQQLEPIFRRRFPFWKDTLDVVGALLALVVLSPLFLLVALFIKIVSPGPVFFKQTRIGYRGRPFTFWKFRTMHVDNDASQHQKYLSTLISSGDQPMTKLDAERDPRIIPFGKLFRQSCIDELPQLINVLLGDMSLVGPRPCLPNEAEDFNLWHTRRFDTIPGMTGLWQVNGKNKTTFKQMMRYDISYARQDSFWTDLKIIFKTIPAIIVMVREQLAARRTASVESKALASAKKVS
ncbi:MAG TPA: sugar transferase [Candidatus Deferrimicrobiaceae bacterium]|jgi:lipopolysaccharide/colanic/teichoic acid biosynthesis glycosyltransferase